MARTGITFEQVSTAAETLAAEGIQPTIKAIRERLTTGSPNTIHEHLKQWKESRTITMHKTATLPESLNAAIATAIAKAAQEAREEVETQFEQSKEETELITAYSKNLEAENEEMKQNIIIIARRRDMLEGKNEELTKEIERLRNQLETEAKERIKAEQLAAVAQAKFDVVTKTNTITTTKKTRNNSNKKTIAND